MKDHLETRGSKESLVENLSINITGRDHKMAEKHHSMRSIHFWKCYWITLRPYLFFISGIAGCLGIVNHPAVPVYKFVLGIITFFLTYGFGQALTDVFQTDTDSLSSPYRPLVRGLITKNQVLMVSLLALTCCVAIFTYLNPWLLIAGVIGVIGLILYTFFKRRWWGGPFWNAWIVALLTLMGKMIGEPRFLNFPDLFDNMLVLSMGSIFFSYAIFVLSGYLKDVSADKTTGYKTIPVRFGWNTALVISILLTIITFLFSFLILNKNNIFLLNSISELLILLVWIGSLFTFGFAYFQLYSINKEERLAFKGIANIVRGFLVIHLAEIFSFNQALIVFGIGYYLFFEVVLFFRPEKSQV
ncbi:hypothetical protein BVY01_00330 [bacterium I07]|nr:hypothetical protein BVY01_00330 [bacterium I07]